MINICQISQLISIFGRMRRTKFWRPMSGLITNGTMSCLNGTRISLVELNTWGYLAIKSGFPMWFFTTGSLQDWEKPQKSPSERISRDFYDVELYCCSIKKGYPGDLIFVIFQCWRLFQGVVPKSRRCGSQRKCLLGASDQIPLRLSGQCDVLSFRWPDLSPQTQLLDVRRVHG